MRCIIPTAPTASVFAPHFSSPEEPNDGRRARAYDGRMLSLNLYATLRAICGQKTLELSPAESATIRDLLALAISEHPALQAELFERDGQLRPHTNILKNGRNIRYLERALDEHVTAGDRLDVFPAVAGG